MKIENTKTKEIRDFRGFENKVFKQSKIFCVQKIFLIFKDLNGAKNPEVFEHV